MLFVDWIPSFEGMTDRVNMKNNLVKVLSLAVLFIVIPVVFGSANAASLKFDKTTVSTTNGGTFQIAVTVDPGSDPYYQPMFMLFMTVVYSKSIA